MASRYDVGNRSRNYDNYNQMPYENMYQGGYLNAKRNNPSIILNDGHKVLYDAEIESKKMLKTVNIPQAESELSTMRMNDNAAFNAV